MRVKTSITLSESLINTIDKLSESYKSRSEFIEIALWAFVKKLNRNRQNLKDLEILNRRADYLNQEADDVLSYQVAL